MNASARPTVAVAALLLAALSGSCGGASSLARTSLKTQEQLAAEVWKPRLVPQVAALGGKISVAALSRDGEHAAVGDDKGLVLLFDLAHAALTGRIPLHKGAVIALAFAKDASALWSASDDGQVCATDVRTALPTECWRIAKQQTFLLGAAFSLDATRFAAADMYGAGLALWRTSDGKLEAAPEPNGRNVRSIAFSLDGRRFAASGDEGATLCDLSDEQAECRPISPRIPDLHQVAFDPKGRLIVGAQRQIAWSQSKKGRIGPLSKADSLPEAKATAWDMFSFGLSYLARRSGQAFEQIAPLATAGRALALTGNKQLMVASEFGAQLSELGGAEQLAAGADGRFALAVVTEEDALQLTVYRDTPAGPSATTQLAVRLGSQPLAAAASRRLAFVASGAKLWAFDAGTGAVIDVHDLSEPPSSLSAHGELLITGSELAQQPWDVWASRALPGFEHDFFFRGHPVTIACGVTTPGCRTLTDARVLRDAATSKVLRTLEPALADVAALSADGRRVARMQEQQVPYARSERYIQIVNATNGDEIGRIRTPCAVYALALSPDGSRLLVADRICGPGWSVIGDDLDVDQAKLRLYDVATGDELFAIDSEPAQALVFAPNGNDAWVGGVGRDSVIRKLDLRSGELGQTLRGHTDDVTSLASSPDGDRLVSTSRDGTTRLWNTKSGQSVTLLFSGNEWIAYDDAGDFDSSRHGDRLAAAFVAGQALPLDQLAQRSNRPDRVLAVLDAAEPEVLDYFRFMYERRLQRLGLNEQSVAASYRAAPIARIRDVELDGGYANLVIDFEAPGAELASFNVYDNGVPLTRVTGKALSGNRQSVPQRIELVGGDNKIEVSVRARNGLDSPRVTAEIPREPAAHRRIFYLGFGVSNYRDPSIQSADYAHKDAVDLGELMLQAGAKVLVPCETDVTVDGIRAARAFFADASVDDLAIVFVAGHGMHLPNRGHEYVYLTHDVDPRALEARAARLGLFEQLLEEIKPRQKLLLLDTCEAGDETGLPPVALERNAFSALAAAGPHDRFIYNDVTLQTGAVVFSAARGYERSASDPKEQQGLFTSEIIRALSASASADGTPADDAAAPPVTSVGIDDLYARVSRAVALRNPGQHPTIDRENRMAKIELPVVSYLRGARSQEVDRCER